MKTRNYRKWTTFSILAQLTFSVITSMIVFGENDLLKLKGNIESQLLIIVIFISIFITVSVFILKTHITYENDRQILEQEKYFEVIKLLTDAYKLDGELQQQAIKQIKTAKNGIQDLIDDGKWRLEDEHQIDATVKAFTINSKKTIYATHINMNKWDESINKTIFNENVSAIKRGVEIIRIFILDKDELKNTEVRKQISKHTKAGIKTLCVEASNLKPLHIKDFIIYDGERLLVEDVTIGSDIYVSAEIFLKQEIISTWEGMFLSIKDNAQESSLFFKQYC